MMAVLRCEISMEHSSNNIDMEKKGVVGKKTVPFSLHLKSHNESSRMEEGPQI